MYPAYSCTEGLNQIGLIGETGDMEENGDIRRSLGGEKNKLNYSVASRDSITFL